MYKPKSIFWKYLFFISFSILSAAGNMGIIYSINSVIGYYFADTPFAAGKYLYYFSASLVVYFICRWVVSFGVIKFTQNELRKTKLSILKMVIKSSYTSLVINKDKIITAMTRDAGTVVQASVNVVDLITNIVVAVFCFVYMGMLSLKLLLSLFGLIILTVFLYAFSERKRNSLFQKAMVHDDAFIKYLNEIIVGFKEIVIDRRKGFGIESKRMKDSIDNSVLFNRKALISYLNNRIIGQTAFYIFIGIMLLFLGIAFHVSKGVLINFVFLVLYVFGPIEAVVILIPGFSQAFASLNRLNFLKSELLETGSERDDIAKPIAFHQIEVLDLIYEYKPENSTEKAFAIGPVDFQLDKGEVVFVFGGNGSGKTTFINLLIGLFPFDRGEFYINGSKVDSTQTASYRQLFAPVFSDFHLFDEFYGIEHIDEEKARSYLQMFELDGKVVVRDNGFSSIDLSTGQRKRLALICAILENKPILVLDEFAADQDPYFRRKFYSEILGFIKKEGFTVIAITHDDNYYNYCDRIYKMDSGKLKLLDRNRLNHSFSATYMDF